MIIRELLQSWLIVEEKIMIRKIKNIWSALRAIAKYDGVINLTRRVLVFILHFVCRIENYYVSSRKISTLQEEDENQFLPRVDNHSVRNISTNKEADELVAEGFFFGAYELDFRRSLDKGAISICVFVNKELASMNWIADNQKAKDAIDFRPLPIDFNKGDVVGGRALTIPKFRRLGLRAYTGFLLRKYFRQKGYTRSVGAIRVDNYPALANTAKNPEAKIVAKYRLIKILWFSYIKETKMNPITAKELLAQKSDQFKGG